MNDDLRRDHPRHTTGAPQPPIDIQKHRSTGPRTPEGKSRSAQNARKHGLYAQTLRDDELILHRQLVRDLTDHYSPVGPLETALIDQIALTQIRIARTQRLELSYVDATNSHPGDYFRDPAMMTALQTVIRYQAAAQRDLHRQINQLLSLRKDRPEAYEKEVLAVRTARLQRRFQNTFAIADRRDQLINDHAIRQAIEHLLDEKLLHEKRKNELPPDPNLPSRN